MGVRRAFWGGALLLGVLALVAPAGALADGLLAPRGALIFEWHGDPSRGCASVGVCGVQGVLLVRPNEPAFFFTPGHGVPALLDISGSSAVVRVRRTEAGSSGDCVDTNVWPNIGAGGLTVSWRADGTARLLIPRSDGPSSGRCAGPPAGALGADISGRTSGGKHRSFTFPAASHFSAGPYSGTVTSTLAFQPAPSDGFSSSSESGTGSPSGPTKTAPFERVTLRIGMSAPAVNLGITFHGVTDPSCAIFDACGVHGSVSLGLPARHLTVILSAQRRVKRRVSAARALADFRAGRLTLDLPSGGSSAVVRTTESLQRSGGTPCVAANPVRIPLQMWLGNPFGRQHSSRVPVIITPQQGWSGLLRTSCPGPLGIDAFGGPNDSGSQPTLTGGTTTLAGLLSRHGTVRLVTRGTFTAPGYAGTRSGAFTVELTLLKVGAGTVREPVG